MSDSLQVVVVSSMDEIPAAIWDRMAGPANPFMRHAFLAALERSGSASGVSGWLPRHLVLKDSQGEIAAAAPFYVKSHSYGEYVFDWGWAEAYARAGGRYYPKLQCAVPFTPATGPRLLAMPGPRADDHRRALAEGMITLAERAGMSSVHITFCSDAEARLLESANFIRRLGCQYHWTNNGYADFENFLSELSARKRKQIRKERKAVADLNLTIRSLRGADVKARHWDVFHEFYTRTVDRKWGAAYVNREFFDHLSQSELADDVVLIWAERDGVPLGCAFNMIGGDTLYGRTWGAGADIPFLHFEACYYRALDFAIDNNLTRVEAGAQGEHKVARGYLPAATHSAHWIKDPGLRAAVAKFVAHERVLLAEDMDEQAQNGPFRKSAPCD